MDVEALEARTGWRILHRARTASTNDDAAVAARAGAPARTVVVADAQDAGRGREGRAFASPPGGLYASLLLDVPREDVPAGVVALVALAAATSIEAVAAVPARIKWPNDLWIEGRKVGGILLERRGNGPVVAGIGINVEGVPVDLPAAVRPHVTSLAAASDHAPGRDALLRALLGAVDRWLAVRAEPDGAARVEAAWHARLALVGERVTYRFDGAEHEGVLEDVSLHAGLHVRDPLSGPVWRPAEHVQDLRPAGRTI